MSYPHRILKVKVWKDLSLSFLFIFTGISPPNKNKCFIFIFTIDSFASLTKNYCSGDLDNSLNCPLAAGNPAKGSLIVNKICWRNGNKWNLNKVDEYSVPADHSIRYIRLYEVLPVEYSNLGPNAYSINLWYTAIIHSPLGIWDILSHPVKLSAKGALNVIIKHLISLLLWLYSVGHPPFSNQTFTNRFYCRKMIKMNVRYFSRDYCGV